jgi:hypothetical protein
LLLAIARVGAHHTSLAPPQTDPRAPADPLRRRRRRTRVSDIARWPRSRPGRQRREWSPIARCRYSQPARGLLLPTSVPAHACRSSKRPSQGVLGWIRSSSFHGARAALGLLELDRPHQAEAAHLPHDQRALGQRTGSLQQQLAAPNGRPAPARPAPGASPRHRCVDGQRRHLLPRWSWGSRRRTATRARARTSLVQRPSATAAVSSTERCGATWWR